MALKNTTKRTSFLFHFLCHLRPPTVKIKVNATEEKEKKEKDEKKDGEKEDEKKEEKKDEEKKEDENKEDEAKEGEEGKVEKKEVVDEPQYKMVNRTEIKKHRKALTEVVPTFSLPLPMTPADYAKSVKIFEKLKEYAVTHPPPSSCSHAPIQTHHPTGLRGRSA